LSYETDYKELGIDGHFNDCTPEVLKEPEDDASDTDEGFKETATSDGNTQQLIINLNPQYPKFSPKN